MSYILGVINTCKFTIHKGKQLVNLKSPFLCSNVTLDKIKRPLTYFQTQVILHSKADAEYTQYRKNSHVLMREKQNNRKTGEGYNWANHQKINTGNELT